MSEYVARLVWALVLALAAYLAVYRPLQLRWGASREEVARAMPGDDIQPRPIFNATRALTINARPEQIWPWLVQIGYKRAGWYGYDWVDNAGIASAKRIMPEWQPIQRNGMRPLLAASATALTTIGLVPMRPPIWVDGMATFGVFMGLWWMYRSPSPGTMRRREATKTPLAGQGSSPPD